MGRLAVTTNVTLDGVMQAPGAPDEDTRDGFGYGGWATPYNDQVMARKMGEGMGQTDAMLFGRLTYQRFYDSWAHRTDGNPFTAMMNGVDKYVVSSTLANALPWANSTLLTGVAAVAELKKSDRNIAVIGSGQLAQSLFGLGLVDEWTLLIHPLVLGAGRRLFTDGGPAGRMRLVDTITTGTGVIIATYRPVGPTADGGVIR